MEMETRAFTIADPDEEGRTIRGRVHLPAGAEDADPGLPYVMILHGFKGFIDWGFFPELTARIVARGMAAVPFNFSGSGIGENPLEISEDEAFANNTPSRSMEDAGRVRAMIAEGALPGIDPNRAAIFGHSVGGAIALLHAAQRHDYAALVAFAPVGDFVRRLGDTEAWRRLGYQEVPNARTGQIHRLGLNWLDDVMNNRERFDVRAACARLSTPTLICHGTDDAAVPFGEGERLHQAFAEGDSRLLRLEGANHTFGATHPLAGVGPDLERVLRAAVDHFAAHLLK